MTNSSPEISVIVVTTKHPDDVGCVKLLEAGTFNNYEIIFRDDPGISAARNAGIREASADKLVFLDDDSHPCQHYLELVNRLLEDHPIITGRIRHPTQEWVGTLATHYDQGNQITQTDIITGCNMGMRRFVFEDIGYFDENIEWGHDETEWMDRASDEYYALYHPSLEVVHQYVDSVYDYYRKQWQMGKADVYYYTKHKNMIRWWVKEIFYPSRYYREDISLFAGEGVANLMKNVSRLLEIVQVKFKNG